MARMVALLRGVNVGGNRKLPMDQLRALAVALGWSGVETYIQSGNLIFEATEPPAAAEKKLEGAMARRFGFPVEAIVRSAAAWKRYIETPFADAASDRPQLLHLALCKAKPAPGAVAQLRARAAAGERIELAGDALWIDFAGGVGKSKLTPTLLDRAVGSTVTARNWKTVVQLAVMIEG